MQVNIFSVKHWMTCVTLMTLGTATLHAQPARPDFANGVFKSKEHGLQVKLPAGWDVGTSSVPGSIAVFFSPDDKNGSLNLFHREATDEDADAIIAELQKEIRDHDASATIEATEDAKLGGEPARQFTYRVKMGGDEQSGLMRVGIHANKAYIFMYSEPSAVYDKSIASIKKIMDALKWMPAKK